MEFITASSIAKGEPSNGIDALAKQIDYMAERCDRICGRLAGVAAALHDPRPQPVETNHPPQPQPVTLEGRLRRLSLVIAAIEHAAEVIDRGPC